MRSLLTAPPAPPAENVCPNPPDDLFAPVEIPRICSAIVVNEDLADCRETSMKAIDACNAQLRKAQDEIRKK